MTQVIKPQGPTTERPSISFAKGVSVDENIKTMFRDHFAQQQKATRAACLKDGVFSLTFLSSIFTLIGTLFSSDAVADQKATQFTTALKTQGLSARISCAEHVFPNQKPHLEKQADLLQSKAAGTNPGNVASLRRNQKALSKALDTIVKDMVQIAPEGRAAEFLGDLLDSLQEAANTGALVGGLELDASHVTKLRGSIFDTYVMTHLGSEFASAKAIPEPSDVEDAAISLAVTLGYDATNMKAIKKEIADRDIVNTFLKGVALFAADPKTAAQAEKRGEIPASAAPAANSINATVEAAKEMIAASFDLSAVAQSHVDALEEATVALAGRREAIESASKEIQELISKRNDLVVSLVPRDTTKLSKSADAESGVGGATPDFMKGAISQSEEIRLLSSEIATKSDELRKLTSEKTLEAIRHEVVVSAASKKALAIKHAYELHKSQAEQIAAVLGKSTDEVMGQKLPSEIFVGNTVDVNEATKFLTKQVLEMDTVRFAEFNFEQAKARKVLVEGAGRDMHDHVAKELSSGKTFISAGTPTGRGVKLAKTLIKSATSRLTAEEHEEALSLADTFSKMGLLGLAEGSVTKSALATVRNQKATREMPEVGSFLKKTKEDLVWAGIQEDVNERDALLAAKKEHKSLLNDVLTELTAEEYEDAIERPLFEDTDAPEVKPSRLDAPRSRSSVPSLRSMATTAGTIGLGLLAAFSGSGRPEVAPTVASNTTLPGPFDPAMPQPATLPTGELFEGIAQSIVHPMDTRSKELSAAIQGTSPFDNTPLTGVCKFEDCGICLADDSGLPAPKTAGALPAPSTSVASEVLTPRESFLGSLASNTTA